MKTQQRKLNIKVVFTDLTDLVAEDYMAEKSFTDEPVCGGWKVSQVNG